MTNKITIIATVKARIGSEDQLKQALLDLARASQTEPGCMQYDLHQSLDDPRHFVFFENWTDQDTLDLHSNSIAMAAHTAKVEPWIADLKIQRLQYLAGQDRNHWDLDNITHDI